MYMSGSDPIVAKLLEDQTKLLAAQIQKAEKEANYAKWFGVLAILFSTLSLIPDWYNFCTNSDYKNTERISKCIEALESSQTNLQSSTTESLKHIEGKFDTLLTILDLKLHHQQNTSEKTYKLLKTYLK